MPYANIHEAFGQLGGADNSSAGSTLDSIRNPFHINTTDPADDFPNIANNYTPDGYNVRYSGRNEWDILDEDIRGLNAPLNEAVTQGPDRVVPLAVPDSIKPVAHHRGTIDKLWNRPTSSELDDVKLDARRIATREALGQSLTTDRGRQVVMLPAPAVNGSSAPDGAGPGEAFAPTDGGTTALPKDCSDDSCMTLLNHILACDNCAEKLKKLLGVNTSGNRLFGFEIPEVNLSKMMFWIILIIMIVAVYELLNTLLKKLRTPRLNF